MSAVSFPVPTFLSWSQLTSSLENRTALREIFGLDTPINGEYNFVTDCIYKACHSSASSLEAIQKKMEAHFTTHERASIFQIFEDVTTEMERHNALSSHLGEEGYHRQIESTRLLMTHITTLLGMVDVTNRSDVYNSTEKLQKIIDSEIRPENGTAVNQLYHVIVIKLYQSAVEKLSQYKDSMPPDALILLRNAVKVCYRSYLYAVLSTDNSVMNHVEKLTPLLNFLVIHMYEAIMANPLTYKSKENHMIQ